MTDLDKKTQKAQTDLVQSVLEAFEKRNSDRVDVLISNAIKQLKMSRFKPDQTTCLSLIYLARICPKIFAQSAGIRELLKTHIKRDNGPASIKGAKNDIILPVLAANILLACCDSKEIKTIILHRIELWLSASQKPAEMVLNLLVILSMKSQGDQQTIATLIEMRQHWLPYFHENSLDYCRVPSDLCAGIRNLLHTETSCETLNDNLKFLIKHDDDIIGLSREVSRFMIERPISVASMLSHEQFGDQLIQMLLCIYNKLFEQLACPPPENLNPSSDSATATATATAASVQQPPEAPAVQINIVGLISKADTKTEQGLTKPIVIEPKKVLIKLETKPTADCGVKQKQDPKEDPTTPNINTEGLGDPPSTTLLNPAPPPLYIKLASKDLVVAVDRITIEAILTLLAAIDLNSDKYRDEFKDLLDCWLFDIRENSKPYIYEDFCMTTPYYLPSRMRQQLVHSTNEQLIEFGLHHADVDQLIELLQLFGLPLSTLNRIINKLESIQSSDDLAATLKDACYFNPLLEHYTDMGVKGAAHLGQRLGATKA